MNPLDALVKIQQLSQTLERNLVSDVKLPQLQLGQVVSAKVDSQLPDGSFKVVIGNQSLQMNLPLGTKSGEILRMTVISLDPRPTFALQQNEAPQAASSFSSAGTLLNSLLSQKPAPVTSQTPILPGAPLDVKQVAQALQDTVAKSGLFYESHQGQWVAGERPLEKILQEPQGKLSSPQAFQIAAKEATLAAAIQPNTVAAPRTQAQSLPQSQALPEGGTQSPQWSVLPEGKAQPLTKDQVQAVSQAQIPSLSQPQIQTLPQSQDSPAQSNTGALPQSDAVAPKEMIKPDAMPIVRQQLEALETNQFVFSGQVWPNQTMDWQIHEESGRNSQGIEAEKAWQSRLRLDMPNMGEVVASLRLTSSGVQIKLQAANPSTLSALKTEGGKLQSSLEASGVSLLSMQVKNAEA